MEEMMALIMAGLGSMFTGAFGILALLIGALLVVIAFKLAFD